jgi:predicted MPP superfamily phosphohydrolase
MDALLAILLALIGLAALCAIWGVFIERQLFVIRRDSVRVLPAGAKPISVLHIADIHMAPWQRRKQRWLERTLAAEAYDLVVDTGDNLGHVDGIAPVLAALKPALGHPGVFVNGSNDYYAPVLRNPLAYLWKNSDRSHGRALDTARLTGAFEAAGWHNLNNRGSVAEVNGTRIGFIGVDDAHDGLAQPRTLPAQLEANGKVDLTIGVTHAPYLNIVRAMADADAQLVFAGHTHGGQVAVPGLGALTTNCDLPPRFAKGLSAWAGSSGKSTILGVSAGLGHSIFAPVRFAVRPEVRILTLLPA